MVLRGVGGGAGAIVSSLFSNVLVMLHPQLPEGPTHVRQRSSPDAFFRPTVNGSSSDKNLSVRDTGGGKQKSFDDSAGMSRVYGFLGSPAKTRKNLMVKTFFFEL